MFLLEMNVINEQEIHLKEVILDIGIRLRTSTLSESVRRIKIGPLTNQHALVIDEITPEALIENIGAVDEIIEKSNLFDTTVVVNKTHDEETKLLGKQSDENSVELYETKRMTRQRWGVHRNENSNDSDVR